jgi:hypothetical protein
MQNNLAHIIQQIFQKCCNINFMTQVIHNLVDDCSGRILKKQPCSFQLVFFTLPRLPVMQSVHSVTHNANIILNLHESEIIPCSL